MDDKVLPCDFLMAIEASAKKEMSNWRRKNAKSKKITSKSPATTAAGNYIIFFRLEKFLM